MLPSTWATKYVEDNLPRGFWRRRLPVELQVRGSVPLPWSRAGCMENKQDFCPPQLGTAPEIKYQYPILRPSGSECLEMEPRGAMESITETPKGRRDMRQNKPERVTPMPRDMEL
ncbi:uncharacterized protein AAES06_022056 isoform 4-T4 [Glossophaga mutica]